MDILKGYKPENVLGYFEQITRIPRGSGNCEEISQFLVDFAKSHNYEYFRDKLNNVVIKVNNKSKHRRFRFINTRNPTK